MSDLSVCLGPYLNEDHSNANEQHQCLGEDTDKKPREESWFFFEKGE